MQHLRITTRNSTVKICTLTNNFVSHIRVLLFFQILYVLYLLQLLMCVLFLKVFIFSFRGCEFLVIYHWCSCLFFFLVWINALSPLKVVLNNDSVRSHWHTGLMSPPADTGKMCPVLSTLLGKWKLVFKTQTLSCCLTSTVLDLIILMDNIRISIW